MEGGPIQVVATLKMKSECIETARPEVNKAIQATRNEPGCISYNWYQDAKEAGTFVVIESFKDMAAFEAHRNSEHMKALGEQAKEWSAAPGEVRVLKPENVKN